MLSMMEENNLFEREESSQDARPASPQSFGMNTQSSGSQYYYSGQGRQVSYQRPTPPTYTPPVQAQTPVATPRVSSYEVGVKPAKQKTFGTGKLIAVFAIVAVIAILVGGVGGYFAASLRLSGNGANAQSTPSGGGNVVMYESDSNGSTSPVLDSGSTIADISNKVAPSVVEITTESAQSGGFMSQYITEGAGSGVIVSQDGYIVTNNHVIEGAKKITVILKNGDSHEATLVGTDTLTDIAVIKINASGLTPAVYGSSAELNVGDFALAVGNPLGELGGTVTDGIISALEREVVIDSVTMTLLQTNAAINPGNSGGGLFNASGELIGIVNAKAAGSDIEGLGFAIPIDIAKPVIEDLISYGYVTGRVQAGIQILDVLDYSTAFQYRVSKLGPYVYSVNEGSDAERAGMKSGDLITQINDTLVYESAEIVSIFADCEIGDTVTVKVEREGREIEIKMTFTEQKPQN